MTHTAGRPQSGCACGRRQAAADTASIACSDAAHRVDRVDALIRPRRVGGPADRVASPADHALVGDDDVADRSARRRSPASGGRGKHLGRRDRAACDAGRRPADRGCHRSHSACAPVKPHSSFTGKAITIVGRFAGRSAGDQPRKGRDHRRHRALVVARPAAIDAAVAHFAAERIDRHAVDRHRVLMHVPQLQFAAVARRTDSPAPAASRFSRPGCTSCRSQRQPSRSQRPCKKSVSRASP